MFIRMVEENKTDNIKKDKFSESNPANESSQNSSNLDVTKEDMQSNLAKPVAEQEDAKKHISKKDKKLYEEISIPSEISAEIIDDILIMKKEDKEIKRKLNPLISVRVDGGKVIVSAKRMRRIEKRLFGTYRAHIKNMIKGLEEGFVFKLQIANVHFPMNVSYDKANNELVVKNFLGEKTDRKIKLNDDVDVKVDKDIIEVSSHDIEKAGIAATKIEKGTKVRNKDRRVFQDGCFISVKPGRVYL